MKKIQFILFAIGAAVAAPVSSFAMYPVFDVAAFGQLIKSYQQGTQQLQQLGQIVRLNSQQLNTLNSLKTAVGVAQRTLPPNSITANQLTALAQGLGLDHNGNISKIYQASGPFAGSLDVFMGTSLQNFQSSQANPWSAFQNTAVNNSIQAIGMSVNTPNREIAFAQQVAGMDISTRQANQTQIGLGLAQLATQRYADAATDRRVAIQAEANIANDASKRAAKATTLNETAAASAELAASNARLQAVASQQQNAANETLVIQADRTNSALSDMEARRKREEIESRLSAESTGNVY